MSNPTTIRKHHPAKVKTARHRQEPKRSDYPGDADYLNDLKKWKERDRLDVENRTKGE